jgi:predicted dehydrogenase
MLKIGIVGAENSHSRGIARTLNVDRRIRGVRVEAIWGERFSWAESVAADGDIPVIVRGPEDLIGMVDAAIVDHRHGKYHLPAARPLLAARMPLFIDKPFCCSLAEGRRFLAEARRLRVPVCSFGTMPLQKSFVQARRRTCRLGRLLSLTTTGPADLRSKYGGIFFYGIHQIEMILRVAGLDFTHARVNRSGRGGTATLWHAGGLVATANLVADAWPQFHLNAVGEKGVVSEPIKSDPNPHLTGIRHFVRAFRGGRLPVSEREILGPIAILEALQKSLKKRGSRVRIARF